MTSTKKYVGDFETTTDKDDLRVWASCLVNIDTLEIEHLGTTIDELFEFLKNKNSVIYFHNLKFDGEYVVSHLLLKGFKYSSTHEANTFECLITDSGLFYAITVYFSKGNKKCKKVVFYDSLKKLPFKVSSIAKTFKLKEEKLSIDYKAKREIGHLLTNEEKQYIINDCVIVAQALHIQLDKGLKKMTNASDAMSHYKEMIGKKQFERWFPVFPLEMDERIRKAYKGGFTYLTPTYKMQRVKGGVTLDVNSLYPWAMYYQPLPWGYPVFFEGEYEYDEHYPVFIARIQCAFDIKENHIPCLQLKKNRWFNETEYLSTSDGRIVEMTLTSVDLKLLIDHYDITNYEMLDGWKFKTNTDMFKPYIDYWMHIKETTTGGERQLAKLMLNSLYGKFASNPHRRKKIPYLDENEVVQYELDEVELVDPVYTPVAAFITSYAREKTIRSAQSVYDRFIYADTDSLHLVGTHLPEGLEIHPTKLGAWKHEGTFTDSLYIRAKTYIETIDGELKVTCAGMPENVKELVTYENFHSGSVFDGKLVPRRYKGGVLLVETTFTIK